MLLVKYILLAGGMGMFITALATLAADAQRMWRDPEHAHVRWLRVGRLVVIGIVPMLVALSIVVVPSGMTAVRVSQISGTPAGTLNAGTHFVVPLVHHVELFNVRDER